QGEDEVLVPLGAGEGLDLLAGGRLPHLEGAVEAAGEDVFVVGREGDGVDGLGVPLEGGGDARGRVGGAAAGPGEGDQQQGGGQGGQAEQRQREFAHGSVLRGGVVRVGQGGAAPRRYGGSAAAVVS